MTVIDAGPLLGNWHEEGRPPADGTGTTPAQAAFNPDEPRDDHGRWGDGGGWAKAGPGDLAAAEKSGVKDAQPLSGGKQASTRLVTYNDGSRWVHKDFQQPAPVGLLVRGTDDLANSEEAASLVARAVGARIAPVVRTGRNSVATPFVPNEGAYGVHDTGPAVMPKDRLIGLVDGLTANNDRNPANLLKTPDGPVGIDQSETWRWPDGRWEIGSPLASALKQGDFTAAELAAIGRRLEALRPDFQRIFGGTRQFDGTMRAWEHIKGAIGPAQAASGAGTTPEAAAGAIRYAGGELATQVHEQLRARWPAGYREAASQGAGQDAVVPASRLRTVMPQPYPERVDGYRAQLRAGGDIGPSLAVRWRRHLVLVDGTHRAAARVLEGQRAIPATVLNLP